MALHDYSEIDEDDFYGQNFEKAGVVSLWAGLAERSTIPDKLDVLQDLCGVGYYNNDNQETNFDDFRLVPIADLLKELSYSKSFLTSAVNAAAEKGVSDVRWVVVQYDFAYEPSRVKRAIAQDPTFLGVFRYSRK